MKEWLAKWVLGGIVRDVAAGKKGEGLKHLYWTLSGKKTAFSALAGLAFAGLAAWRPDLAVAWAPSMTAVLGLLVTIGIVDREWKSTAPLEEWKRWLSKILSAGPVISGVFAVLAQLVPHLCAVCSAYVPHVEWLAGAVAAATAWLAARWNVPPAFPSRRADDLVVVNVPVK